MSDEQPKGKGEPSEALTGPVQRTPVHGGGRLNGGGRVREIEPTAVHVSQLALKRLYQRIPELNRLAANKPKRPHGKKNGPLKRPHSATDQIRAIAELRALAMLDRTLREAEVMRALMKTRDEIVEFFEGDRQRADALMTKIAPHWLSI